ncbi:Uma2 family endonuclease [Azospirillum agricola]|uniref:Uma2 family endonuclease n=1 Tax=Azospirillum agricola TaxID=1720247 RepID=UPI001AE29931|nr:Uma2 family endonuclease [Azospirillum agricola]MBP2228260.1 Uma2 family endonuclease [Azospirillum agricola]
MEGQTMAEAAWRFDPVTLEEFQTMSFGDRKAELIDGLVVLAQAFPTSRHGDITGGVLVALAGALRAGQRPCRAQTGTGLPIRLDRDYYLGPDVMVHCGGSRDAPGAPILVVEVLSPSNSASEMMKKLRAYQAVGSIADILFIDQDAYAVEHWTRDDRDAWTLSPRLSGANAVLVLPRLGGEWPLEVLYGDA